ncbi:10636_t:CDS:2, partial [Racocetra persica]
STCHFYAIVESINDMEENPPPDPNNKLTVKELQQQIDFTDEDLIQAAIEVKQVEEEFVIPTLTGEEQLNILRGALRIVNERIDDSGIIMKSLRKLQSCIREEVQKEKARKQVQCRLDQYFT